MAQIAENLKSSERGNIWDDRLLNVLIAIIIMLELKFYTHNVYNTIFVNKIREYKIYR